MVALKDDRPLRHLALVLLVLDAGRSLDLRILVDQDVVLVHGGAGLLHELAVGVEPRCAEEDVERLPLARGLRGDHLGRRLAVERAALVGLGLLAVGVQDLDLVAALHPDAAVAAALQRLAELHVQVAVAELLLAADVALVGRRHALVVHGPAGRVGAAPRVPVVAHLLRLAAEEHDGPFGRLHRQLGIDRDLALGLGVRLRDRRCGQDAAQRQHYCAKPSSACHELLLP